MDDNEELLKVTLPPIELNSELEVYLAQVLHVESPSMFYLRLFETKEYYEQFAKNLNERYIKGSPLLDHTVPLPIESHWCVCSNKIWHRAKVSRSIRPRFSQDVWQYEMLLVDLGSSGLFGINDVRQLEEEFTLDPPLAIPCCLWKVYPNSPFELNPWLKESIRQFIEFCVNSPRFTAVFASKSLNNLYEVILESSDGTVINEKMSKEKDLTQRLNKYIESKKNGIVQKKNNIIKDTPNSSEIPKNWDPMAEDFKKGLQLDSECASTMFLGIKNEDEKIICRFFRQGKPCPRGDVCRWAHIKPRKDGLPSSYILAHNEIHNPLKLPKEDTVHQIYVPVVFSPTVFYVQFINDDTEAFNELKEAMNTFYAKSKPNVGLGTTLPSCGEIMVVNKPEDPFKGWHRVRILELEGINDISVQVFYIDIGITEWVDEKYLRAILPKFLQLPVQAVECWLYGLKAKNGDWEKDAISHFCNFIEGKLLLAEVISIESVSDRLGLVILDNSNGNYLVLNDEMIARGLALLEEEEATSSEEETNSQNSKSSFSR